MNIGLMEKIAKSKEDTNDPYGKWYRDVQDKYYAGKKLSKKDVFKAALSGSRNDGTRYISALGAGLGAFAGSIPGSNSGNLKNFAKYTGAGAIIGGAIPAVWDTAGYIVKELPDLKKQRALSYLPNKEGVDADTDLWWARRRYIGEVDPYDGVRNEKAVAIRKKELDEATQQYNDALARGKALMLEEKKNRRLSKKASLDYDEMVKFAYEDILGGFEKSAEENTEEAKREQKKEMMKRLAATSALTAGATFGGVALYKKINNSGNCYPKIKKFRGNIEKVTKGKPVVKLRSDEWEVVGTTPKSNPVKLTPLLSAGN